MFRKYEVASTTNRATRKIERFFVTDAKDDKELSERPHAAEFPISEMHYEEMQRQRAQDYCDYLNKLVEAAESAYNNNQLVNILKAT